MSRTTSAPTAEQLADFFKDTWTQHDTRIPLIFAVEIPVIVLTVSVVALRFYARTRIKKTLGADDWVMGLAAIFAVALTTLNCVATRYGAGRHLWDIDLFQHGKLGGKLAYVYAVLFTPAVVLAKMSICMTYLRIFPKTTDRWFAKGVIFWLIISGIGCTIAMIVPCIPIEAYWDLTIVERKCYNARLGLVITSALNTTTDLLVFLWPAPRLFSLRLPLRQRLGLIFVFSIGCLTCAAGIARIWFLSTHFYKSQDIFYNLAMLYVLSSLDCNLGILCGSLPEIRVFFSPAFDKLGSMIGSTVRRHRRRPSTEKSGSHSSNKYGHGVLSPNAYDLEKSTRPRPDLEDLREDSFVDGDDGLRGSAESSGNGAGGGGLDSRQMSINIMLDEGNGHSQNYGPGHSYEHGTGMRSIRQDAHRHTFGPQSMSPHLLSPGRRAEVTESKFSA